MKSVNISWTLPTTRQQGGPLPIEEIASVEIELSADSGANFSPIGAFTPDVLSVPVNDLPFSDQYVARGRCIDTQAQPGNWAVRNFTLSDTSPPGDIVLDVAEV